MSLMKTERCSRDSFCCEGCYEVGLLCTAGGKGGRRDVVFDIVCKLLPRCFKPSSQPDAIRQYTSVDTYIDIIFQYLLCSTVPRVEASLLCKTQKKKSQCGLTSPLSCATYVCKALP